MANISIASIVICFFLILFSLMELVLFIRSINMKNGRKVFIHLIGIVATTLISYSVIKIALGADLSSNMLIKGTIVISTIFFIICSFDSFVVVKSIKN